MRKPSVRSDLRGARAAAGTWFRKGLPPVERSSSDRPWDRPARDNRRGASRILCLV
jgi:hypothetical protein